MGGGAHQLEAQPPSPMRLSSPLLLLSRVCSKVRNVRVLSRSNQRHAVVLLVAPVHNIFFRNPRLDRGRETSSLPDVYEYSGTPYFRLSGVVMDLRDLEVGDDDRLHQPRSSVER